MINPNQDLFRFCPQCGKKKFSPDGETSFLCNICNFKFYINTAAAAIGVIFNTENHLLVTRRKNDPAKGMHDLPGGFAEPGESIEACLKREIKEELNIEISTLSYFCSLPNTYVYKNITYAVTDFVFKCTVHDFHHIRPCDDIIDFKFLPLEQIDKNLFGLESARHVVQLLKS